MSATTAGTAARARPRRSVRFLRPLARLTVNELRLFAREPAALISTLAFPLFLALVLGAAFGRWEATEGYRIVDVNTPGLMAAIAANLALMGLPIAIADYKERGILKRYQASPVPLTWMLAAMHVVGLAILLAGSAVLVITTLAAFGLRFGGDPVAIVVLLALGGTALNAAGFALGGLLATTREAQAIGFALFFPMLFLSGAAFPVDRFPEVLQVVSHAVPLTYVVDPLVGVWTGESLAAQWPSMLVLAGIAAASVALARATFRWH
jgi:ABC-2 type transport system permease protein